MKANSEELYFIAIVPDEPVFTRVNSMKQVFADQYNTKAALRSPPHITLHMPFKWKVMKEALLFESLKFITSCHPAFKIDLKNYGCFEPRVIYINVEENTSLGKLQKDIMKSAAQDWHIYQQPGSRPFKPHMTIAFRDLRKAKFYEAWQKYSEEEIAEHFIARDVVLLRHNGKAWDIHKRFSLQTSQSSC